MSAVDYSDIVGLSWDNIQQPRNLPGGTYLFVLRNMSFVPAKEEGKNPQVIFVHSPKEAMSDVDSDELAKLGEDYDISENKIFTRQFIEDGSSWAAVARLAAKHRTADGPLDLASLDKDVLESIKKVRGMKAEVLGYVKLGKPFTDRATGETRQMNEISEFADPNG